MPSTCPLRVHVHNTRNTGYASALPQPTRCDRAGRLTRRDRYCPFAPRATGNIATEDLVRLERSATTPDSTSTPCVAPVNGSGSLISSDAGIVAKAGGFPQG